MNVAYRLSTNEMEPGTEPSNPCTDPKVIEVALLGATFETPNHGVSALASGTIAAFVNTFPNGRLTFVDYAKHGCTKEEILDRKAVKIELLPLRFSKRPWQFNHVARLILTLLAVRCLFPSSLRHRLTVTSDFVRRLGNPVAYFSIAGGDSFSDIYGIRRFLYVSLPQIMAVVLGRPLVLLPQTYGPFKTRFARAIAKFIVSRAYQIYSRDAEGIEIVQQLLRRPHPRAQFAYDMGFGLEPLQPDSSTVDTLKAKKALGILVGLNVSGLLYMGGYTRNNMFGLSLDYVQLMSALITLLGERLKCQVLLVPHVFGDEQGSETDTIACRQVMADLREKNDGRLHFIDREFDHHQVKYIIGQCDFFIGARMHACIAALSQCVPAVGLAYSRKFAGVLNSVGGGACVVDLRCVNQDQTLAIVNDAFSDRDRLRSQLQERMPAIRAGVLSFFSRSELKPILGSTSRSRDNLS